MVTEAVGELKGEPVPVPVEITIDLPVDANLPRDYVATTCAWRPTDDSPRSRRRPMSTTSATSGRTATGPPSPPAAALLDVARLRAVAVRLGIRSITVQRGTARHRAGAARVARCGCGV